MEGVKFIDLDSSRKGPRGLLDYLEVWCVLGTNGDRFHVSSHNTSDGKKIRQDVSVKPCDMSCRKLELIPSDVSERVPLQMR